MSRSLLSALFAAVLLCSACVSAGSGADGQQTLSAAEDVCDGLFCAECVANTKCGWCAANGRCMAGKPEGPTGDGAVCVSWDFAVCSVESCSRYSNCLTCLRDPFCGWCADRGICEEGTGRASLSGQCKRGWAHVSFIHEERNAPSKGAALRMVCEDAEDGMDASDGAALHTVGATGATGGAELGELNSRVNEPSVPPAVYDESQQEVIIGLLEEGEEDDDAPAGDSAPVTAGALTDAAAASDDASLGLHKSPRLNRLKLEERAAATRLTAAQQEARQLAQDAQRVQQAADATARETHKRLTAELALAKRNGAPASVIAQLQSQLSELKEAWEASTARAEARQAALAEQLDSKLEEETQAIVSAAKQQSQRRAKARWQVLREQQAARMAEAARQSRVADLQWEKIMAGHIAKLEPKKRRKELVLEEITRRFDLAQQRQEAEQSLTTKALAELAEGAEEAEEKLAEAEAAAAADAAQSQALASDERLEEAAVNSTVTIGNRTLAADDAAGIHDAWQAVLKQQSDALAEKEAEMERIRQRVRQRAADERHRQLMKELDWDEQQRPKEFAAYLKRRADQQRKLGKRPDEYNDRVDLASVP